MKQAAEDQQARPKGLMADAIHSGATFKTVLGDISCGRGDARTWLRRLEEDARQQDRLRAELISARSGDGPAASPLLGAKPSRAPSRRFRFHLYRPPDRRAPRCVPVHDSILDVAGLTVRPPSTARLASGVLVMSRTCGARANPTVMGGSTRDTDFSPKETIRRVDAIDICGSSAYGLGAYY